MYSRIASATGWTWEYIGQSLTLPRVRALYAYWKEWPPVNETVALFTGYKPAAGADDKPKLPVIDNAELTANMHADPRFLKWIPQNG